MRVLACLLFVVVAFAGCAGNASGFGVDAPAWAPGHTWEYGWQFEWSGDGENSGGKQWYENEEPLVKRVLRQDTVDGHSGWLVYTEGDTMPFDWTADLSLVENGTFIEHDIWFSMYSYCGDLCGETLAEGMAVDDDQTGAFLDFPLTPGKRWTYGDDGDEYLAQVGSVSSVSTPAGTFDAVAIRFTLDPEVADDEAEMYEEMGATVHRYEVALTQVIDVYYAPSVEHVVMQKMDFDVTYDIDIEWEDGDRETDKGTASMDATMELLGYDLAEEDPASDDDILELLGVGEQTPFPPGQYHPEPQPVPSNVSVAITGMDELNVATVTETSLLATAVGDNGPYTHTWSIWTSDDYYADLEVEGDTADFSLNAPAIARYELRTYDANGTYVDRTPGNVVGYYEDTISGDCDPSVPQVGVAGACPALSIYTSHEFRLRWHIEAELTGGLIGQGHLHLLDPSGYEAASKLMPGGRATIDSTEYGRDGVWNVVVEAPTGIDMAATLTVRVDAEAPYFW